MWRMLPQMRTVALFAAFAWALAGCSGSGGTSSPAPTPPPTSPAPQPPAATTYQNPVLDGDFPDPAVIRASDGLYYAYATQTDEGGRWINIQVARSRDLVSWERMADA